MEALRLTYQCGNCKATDTLKVFADENIPQTFNCWKCGAGQGKEIREMVQTGFGMFLVQKPDEAVVV